MRDAREAHDRRSPTHRELFMLVIADSSSWGQSLTCELNQLLTLRALGRSEHQTSAVELPLAASTV